MIRKGAGWKAIPSPGRGESRSAVRGVAWSGVESGTSAAVGFMLTPLIIRTVGLEGLGLWSACWSVAHTAGILDLGVGTSYARFTSRAIATGDAEALNGTVGAGVGFHLTLSFLIAVASLVLGPIAFARVAPHSRLGGDAPAILTGTLAVVLLRLTLSAYRGVVAGAQRIDLLGQIGTVASVLEGAGGAAVLLSGRGLRGMALNSLGVAVLTCAAEGLTAHHLCPALRVRPFHARSSDWKDVLSFGLRLQATRAAEILGSHAPRLALALGPGLLTAGAYDLGARVAGGLRVVGALPLPVVQPLASRLDARGDRPRLRLLLQRSTRYVALLVVPGAAIILLEAPAILAAWTGLAVPAGAAASARWLAAAVGVSLLLSPTRLTLRGVGRPGIEAAAAISGSLLNLGLAIAVAIPFGAAGVAGAALAGALLSAGIVDAGARGNSAGLLGGSAWRPLLTPLIAGAAAVVAGGALHIAASQGALPLMSRMDALRHLMPGTVLTLSVFVLALVVSGALTREDLAILRDLAPGASPAATGAALTSETGGRL